MPCDPISRDRDDATTLDAHNVSWTAWAWYPGGCNFPAIINDWSGTPNGAGQVIKTALGAYPP